MPYLLRLRRDTAANWSLADPVLGQGEPGYEVDTGKLKVGDGATEWTSLDYFDPGVFGGGSGDVVGPAGATDNAIVRFDGATGKLVQDSGIAIADGASGVLSGTNTGDQTITLTGEVTGSGTGAFAATIANSVVANAKLADMTGPALKGRTSGTGSPQDLTAAQSTSILDAMVGDAGSGGTKGLVPAPAAGDAAAGKYLAAGGGWSVPPGTGGGGTPGGVDAQLQYNDGGAFAGIATVSYDDVAELLTVASSIGHTTSLQFQASGASPGPWLRVTDARQIDFSDSAASPDWDCSLYRGGAKRLKTIGNLGPEYEAGYEYGIVLPVLPFDAVDGLFVQPENGLAAIVDDGVNPVSLWARSAGSWHKLAESTADAAPTRQVQFTIGDGTTEIEAGMVAFTAVQFAGTIAAATLFSLDDAGSAVAGDVSIDLWKDTYANFPPTAADSITASAPPSLSSASKSQDTTLAGWTTSIAAGDCLMARVDSASGVKQAILILTVEPA